MMLKDKEEKNLKIPAHIAVIMDGNRRWAKKRLLPTFAGHSAGVTAVHRLVRSCSKLGIKYLTIYAFSTENWARAKDEVEALMLLLDKAIKEYIGELQEGNVRLVFSGDLSPLPGKTRESLLSGSEKLKNNTGLTLNLALNYGGRQEILMAANKAISSGIKHLDEKTFSSLLYTAGIPDPDLLIRTSGEQRLSNFLLWQTAYTEFYITDTLWPDFNEETLIDAIKSFNKREIRRGA
ncbi:MAG: di-trans,poly-cis-decaprenylcistransferase [Elusimicrobiales bacterium]|nr:di-trans,poly-cis-decaprenylcistransferase [Elusimicrobiales bacterium]